MKIIEQATILQMAAQQRSTGKQNESEHEEQELLGYNDMNFGTSSSTFRRNISPLSSGSHSRPSEKLVGHK
jgi:hypothetical protein